jgi:hypothetical protein
MSDKEAHTESKEDDDQCGATVKALVDVSPALQ